MFKSIINFSESRYQNLPPGKYFWMESKTKYFLNLNHMQLENTLPRTGTVVLVTALCW